MAIYDATSRRTYNIIVKM